MMIGEWLRDWQRKKWEKQMDFKPVTPRQRKLLTQMLYHALVEIRSLCWEKKVEQAAALSDAFHNLPSGIYSENFSFPWFRRALESYQSKYGSDWDFVSMIR